MTNAWEELENRCYEYLRRIYGKDNSIEAYGKSDSTKADIKVEPSSGKEFFIEVKASSSQCCQFVVFPNEKTKKFDFSKGNKAPLTNNSRRIIAYMDGLYKKYYRVGKKGIPVNIDSSILYGWVQDFYSIKNVKFFMTEGTDIIIFPSNSFSNYFDIAAFYRRKPSGSSVPNEKNNNSEITHGLSANNISGTIEYKIVSKERRCFLHSDESLHKRKIMCDKYTYLFKDNKHSKTLSKIKTHVYEVRRLANTSNPNIICQLSLKKNSQDKKDLQVFQNLMIKEE